MKQLVAVTIDDCYAPVFVSMPWILDQVDRNALHSPSSCDVELNHR
jgi:hypothetical protein